MHILKSHLVPIGTLKPHPGNYRKHGADQMGHIMQMLSQFGCYRNIVVACDYTILAGHGVHEGMVKLDFKECSVVKLEIEPNSPQALKILTADNELGKLAEVDDRLLSEHLREVAHSDIDGMGLLGTGFDEAMLANLVFVTRSQSEIQDMDAAREWVGMPSYEPTDPDIAPELTLNIVFKTKEDREKFVSDTNIKIRKKGERVWNTCWPYQERTDMKSVKFDQEAP